MTVSKVETVKRPQHFICARPLSLPPSLLPSLPHPPFLEDDDVVAPNNSVESEEEGHRREESKQRGREGGGAREGGREANFPTCGQ
jgi:hypothetical protein